MAAATFVDGMMGWFVYTKNTPLVIDKKTYFTRGELLTTRLPSSRVGRFQRDRILHLPRHLLRWIHQVG